MMNWFLLLAFAWLVYRWDAFMSASERRQIETAEPDELWWDIYDAANRSQMN